MKNLYFHTKNFKNHSIPGKFIFSHVKLIETVKEKNYKRKSITNQQLFIFNETSVIGTTVFNCLTHKFVKIELAN